MAEKRRALGRGLGALIPSAPSGGANRPVDVFFTEQKAAEGTGSAGVRTTVVEESPHSVNAPHESSDVVGMDGQGHGNDPASARADADLVDLDALRSVHTAERTSEVDSGPVLAPVPGAEFAELPVDSIRPNPKQPRTVFDEDQLAELVHSIREIGVLQPVVVRRIAEAELAEADGKQFELIMGERRWRATREAGLVVIPAIIRDSHDELATRIGRSRPQISNTLRLLKLPPLVQRRLAAGVLSAGHARALLGLSDGAAMERMAQRIVAEGLSVRNVEELVALGEGNDAPKPRRPRAGSRHPQLDDFTSGLSDHLETRVAIALGQRKGKITVEFASMEDLRRILGLMGMSS